MDNAARALVALARRPGTVSIVVLARELQVSEGFLGHIFADLRRAGIVTSQRGNRGGYDVARPPEQITLLDVVRAVHPDPAGPADEPVTVIDQTWIALDRGLDDLLAGVSVHDLVRGRLPRPLASLAARPVQTSP